MADEKLDLSLRDVLIDLGARPNRIFPFDHGGDERRRLLADDAPRHADVIRVAVCGYESANLAAV